MHSSSPPSCSGFPQVTAMLRAMGNFSTRKPTGSPSIRCNSRYLEEPVNHSIFDFHASMAAACWEICQDKATSQRRCELLLSTVELVCRSNRVDRSQGHVHQSIVDIPLVCSCSEISFCDSSNKCFCLLVSRVFGWNVNSPRSPFQSEQLRPSSRTCTFSKSTSSR